MVKQFRNQGAKARLRRRFKGSKAARSWRVAHALLDAGLLTPEPVMLIDSTDESGPSFYVCAHLPDLLEARYLLRAANAGTEREQFPHVDLPSFLTELGRTARRLHDADIWHRDLTSGNVLLRFHADGTPSALYLLDLNRARLDRPLTLSERMRDLSRMPILRPEHQRLFLASYWEGEGRRPSVPRSDWQRSAHEGAEGDRTVGGRRGAQALYLAYHRAFLLKNTTKQRLRGGTRTLKRLLLPRTAHAHIPAAPTDASARDRIVWDHLSDQPHQHAGRLDKLRVRLADARSHAAEGAAVAAALPRIWSRYRALQRSLHAHPVPFQGAGICVRPWPEDPSALLGLLDDLGARAVLLRLHPWEDDHRAELDLARELHARGYELTYALPQNRELVRNPERWRRSIEEIARLFLPYGRRFQVGQAINRSKWGIWNLEEYAILAQAAAEALRQHPGVELLGPSVIDFEYHVTAAVLNLRRPGLRFDAVSSLLYVDRRGAPENEQAGFDTIGKVLLLRAIAETSKNATGRCWITEVNWPLREGPHSPAGRSVSVGEEEAGRLPGPLLSPRPGDGSGREGLLVADDRQGLRPGRSCRSGRSPPATGVPRLPHADPGARRSGPAVRFRRHPARPPLHLPESGRHRGGGGLEHVRFRSPHPSPSGPRRSGTRRTGSSRSHPPRSRSHPFPELLPTLLKTKTPRAFRIRPGCSGSRWGSTCRTAGRPARSRSRSAGS